MTVSAPASPSPLYLGIDTGGTYTDAVLWSQERGIVAKAKSLTTRYDLAVGISGAVDAVIAASGVAPAEIKLVSMSTTLATNALVEGQGGRAALVMIGFGEADLARDGLDKALGSDPVIFSPGGHDVFGAASPLDLAGLAEKLDEWGASVTGIAICSLFATRNPEHELAAASLIRERTSLPVTMSHELSSKLGGPKRALTTLLNARLISIIDRLIHATEGFLASRGIAAPLMVVRGDGALVSADFARNRPIETILSGPAASLVGARHMTGLENAVVADIGGTTTDVAVLDQGRPRIDPEGASVGGFRTMVEAIAMHTYGLGGDSEVVARADGFKTRIVLGPRRLIPLSLAAHLHGEAILKPLEKWQRANVLGRHAGRFVVRSGVPDALAVGLNPAETSLFAKVTTTPQPLEDVISATLHNAALTRLVARGLVQIIGFTPSDAAHVMAKQANWNGEAARAGAILFARQKDAMGAPIAADETALSDWVLRAVTRRSAEVILETLFSEDGHDGSAMLALPVIQRAIDGAGGMARVAVALDRPVIGLGASAGLHHAGLPAYLGIACEVPGDADVANALGAVVGQVRVSATVHVSQPVDGLFRVGVGSQMRDFNSEEEALSEAEVAARAHVTSRAAAAGAAAAEVSVERNIRFSTIEGRRMFVDADVVATAAGRPRIAVG